LKETGFTATWLSPILRSPQVDYGYDISDFKEVDPMFGTNEDLNELFREAKKLGIKVIMDFVPNHTSDKHEWFLKSVEKDPKYDNYYVWHSGKVNPNGGRALPPNNWVRNFLIHLKHVHMCLIFEDIEALVEADVSRYFAQSVEI
jgi:alpha-glucosidase